MRNLEREIATVCRGVAVKVRRGRDVRADDRTGASVAEFLGPPQLFSEIAERTEQPGVATGLAWTPAGGDILFIEATRDAGQGQARHSPASSAT